MRAGGESEAQRWKRYHSACSSWLVRNQLSGNVTQSHRHGAQIFAAPRKDLGRRKACPGVEGGRCPNLIHFFWGCSKIHTGKPPVRRSVTNSNPARRAVRDAFSS